VEERKIWNNKTIKSKRNERGYYTGSLRTIREDSGIQQS